MRVNFNTTVPAKEVFCNPKPKSVDNVIKNSSNVVYIPCITFGNAIPGALPAIYGAECNKGAKSGGVSAVVSDLSQGAYEFTPYYGGITHESIDKQATNFTNPIIMKDKTKHYPLKFKFEGTTILTKVDPYGVIRPVFIHPDKLYEYGGNPANVDPKHVQWLEKVCAKEIETSSGKEEAALYKVINLVNGKPQDLPQKRFYVFTQGTAAMNKAYEGATFAYSTGASKLGAASPYSVNCKAFIELLPMISKDYPVKAVLFNDPQTAYACEFMARKIIENDSFYSNLAAGYICHNPGRGYQDKCSFKAMFLNFANKEEIEMINKNPIFAQKVKGNSFLEEQFFSTFMKDLVDERGSTSGLMIPLRYRENGLLNYLGTVAPGAAESYCIGRGEADGVKDLMQQLFKKGMFQGILNGLNNDGIDPKKDIILPYYNAKTIAEEEAASAARVAATGKGEVLHVPDAIKQEFETFDPDAYEKGIKLIDLKNAETNMAVAKENLPDDIKKLYATFDKAKLELSEAIASKTTQDVIDKAKSAVEVAQKNIDAQTVDKIIAAENKVKLAQTALETATDSNEAQNVLNQARKELTLLKEAQDTHETFLKAQRQYTEAVSAFKQSETALENLGKQIVTDRNEAIAKLKQLNPEFQPPEWVKYEEPVSGTSKTLNKPVDQFALAKAQNAYEDAIEAEKNFNSMFARQNKLSEAFETFEQAKAAFEKSKDSTAAKQTYANALNALEEAKNTFLTQFDLADIVRKKQKNAANLFTRINIAQETGHPEYVLGKKTPGARVWGTIDPKYIKRITSPNEADRQLVDLFVCWGRADEQKGLDIAIESFRRFVEESTEAYKSGKTTRNLAENAVLVMGGPIGESHPVLRDAIRKQVAETLTKDYMKGRFVFLDGFAPNSVLSSASTFAITPSRWAPCELVDHEARKYLGMTIVTGIEGLDDKNFDERFEPGKKPTGFKTKHNNLTTLAEIEEEIKFKKAMETFDGAVKYTNNSIDKTQTIIKGIETDIKALEGKEGTKAQLVALNEKLKTYNGKLSQQQQVITLLENRETLTSSLNAQKIELSKISDEYNAAMEQQSAEMKKYLELVAENKDDIPEASRKTINQTLRKTKAVIEKAENIKQEISHLEDSLSALNAKIRLKSGHLAIISERTEELLADYYAELNEFKAKLRKSLERKRLLVGKESNVLSVLHPHDIERDIEAYVIENLEEKSGEKARLAPKLQAVIDSMTNDDLLEIYKSTAKLSSSDRYRYMLNNHDMKIRWENNSELQRIWVQGQNNGFRFVPGHFEKTDLSGKALYDLCFNGPKAKAKRSLINVSSDTLLAAQNKIIKLLKSVGENTDDLVVDAKHDVFVPPEKIKFEPQKGLSFAEKYMTKQTALIVAGTVLAFGAAYYLFSPKKDDAKTSTEKKNHASTFIA